MSPVCAKLILSAKGLIKVLARVLGEKGFQVFLVSINEFYAFKVGNTKATNGLLATHFKDTTTFDEVLEACTAQWDLTAEQSDELRAEMLKAVLATTKPSLGAAARAMGYEALVD
jgi:hypothetical protein